MWSTGKAPEEAWLHLRWHQGFVLEIEVEIDLEALGLSGLDQQSRRWVDEVEEVNEVNDVLVSLFTQPALRFVESVRFEVDDPYLGRGCAGCGEARARAGRAATRGPPGVCNTRP